MATIICIAGDIATLGVVVWLLTLAVCDHTFPAGVAAGWVTVNWALLCLVWRRLSALEKAASAADGEFSL